MRGPQLRNRWNQLLRMMRVAGAMPFELSAHDDSDYPSGVALHVYTPPAVTERDDASLPAQIAFVFGIPLDVRKRDRVRFVHHALGKCMLHELDENLYVRGRREFDPHAPGARRFRTEV